MAIKRRARALVHTEDAAWFCVFVGDECPADFNPIRFMRFESAVIFHGKRDGADYADAAVAAWQRLRPQVLAEWGRRRRKGQPPGAALDSPAPKAAALCDESPAKTRRTRKV